MSEEVKRNRVAVVGKESFSAKLARLILPHIDGAKIVEESDIGAELAAKVAEEARSVGCPTRQYMKRTLRVKD